MFDSIPELENTLQQLMFWLVQKDWHIMGRGGGLYNQTLGGNSNVGLS